MVHSGQENTSILGKSYQFGQPIILFRGYWKFILCFVLKRKKERCQFMDYNSECEKLLGVKINVNLKFSDPISDWYKKGSRKISALARVNPFMELMKRKLWMNAVITSHFTFCPLIWMCYSRSNNTKINMFHERCLRVIYNHKRSSFTELMNKDSSLLIHIKNIQRLAIEMFGFYNGLSPPLMNDIFKC